MSFHGYNKEGSEDFDNAVALFADDSEWIVPTVFVADIRAKQGLQNPKLLCSEDRAAYTATTRKELLALLGDVKPFEGVRKANADDPGIKVLVKPTVHKARSPIILVMVWDAGKMRQKCMCSVPSAGGDLKTAVITMNTVAQRFQRTFCNLTDGASVGAQGLSLEGPRRRHPTSNVRTHEMLHVCVVGIQSP